MYRWRWLLLGSGVLVLGAFAPGADPSMAEMPKYTKDQEMILPSGYHTWVFVGADLGLKYASGLAEAAQRTRHDDEEYGDFHNIYIDRVAYDHFLKTKTFPDPTVLVMEVFRAEKKDAGAILKAGQFQGKRISLEAAVKDSKRPGGGVPWAYYIFQAGEDAAPNRSAPAMPDAACYDCHKKHASTDNVWVQFYPMLRDSQLQDSKQR
jgi:hypothetical protein